MFLYHEIFSLHLRPTFSFYSFFLIICYPSTYSNLASFCVSFCSYSFFPPKICSPTHLSPSRPFSQEPPSTPCYVSSQCACLSTNSFHVRILHLSFPLHPFSLIQTSQELSNTSCYVSFPCVCLFTNFSLERLIHLSFPLLFYPIQTSQEPPITPFYVSFPWVSVYPQIPLS